MNDWTSGVVRTPPKSEITTSIRAASAIGADDLVMAEPVAALHRPAEEGDLGVKPGAAQGAGADQRARAPQRGGGILLGPELERRPPLDAVRAVLGREQHLGDLDRGPVGIAEDRRDLLVAMG